MDWSVGSEDSKVAAARQQQQCGVISVHAARSGFAKKCGRGRVAAVVWQQRQAVAWSMSVAAAAHRVMLSCVRAARQGADHERFQAWECVSLHRSALA